MAFRVQISCGDYVPRDAGKQTQRLGLNLWEAEMATTGRWVFKRWRPSCTPQKGGICSFIPRQLRTKNTQICFRHRHWTGGADAPLLFSASLTHDFPLLSFAVNLLDTSTIIGDWGWLTYPSHGVSIQGGNRQWRHIAGGASAHPRVSLRCSHFPYFFLRTAR